MMYEFSSRADVTVVLHDENGQRVGKVKFNGGRYRTTAADEAAAIERAAQTASEFRIACVSQPAPAEAPAAAAEDTPPPAQRRQRHTKGNKHNG